MDPTAPVDPGEFLQTLPPSLRQSLLADKEESQISALPAELAAEAQNLCKDYEQVFLADPRCQQAIHYYIILFWELSRLWKYHIIVSSEKPANDAREVLQSRQPQWRTHSLLHSQKHSWRPFL